MHSFFRLEAHMTTIELTDEQRHAVQIEPGKPVDVIDPATKEAYVLLAREQYERVRSLLEQPMPAAALEPHPGVTPIMLQSQQAYWRELPGLLKEKSRKRQWVAYHGDERIAFGRTDIEIYQECLRRGLKRGEFYVGELEADPEDLPPWASRPL